MDVEEFVDRASGCLAWAMVLFIAFGIITVLIGIPVCFAFGSSAGTAVFFMGGAFAVAAFLVFFGIVVLES